MSARIDITTGLLFLVALVVVAVLLIHGPVPQDPAYHAFADQGTLFNIPHFQNVISNIPYVLVGIAGISLVARNEIPGGLAGLRLHYLLFFIGVTLVGAGSAWYHLSPSNASLVWDRLPMTIAFMAFFTAIVGEYYTVETGRRLLWPMVAAGLISVIYWHMTEQAGKGDLRPYAVVQFLPMLLIPLIVFIRPARLQPSSYLWGMMLCYLLAKIMELYDSEIYSMTGFMGGHALKHLVSAVGTGFYYLALKKRRVTMRHCHA